LVDATASVHGLAQRRTSLSWLLVAAALVTAGASGGCTPYDPSKIAFVDGDGQSGSGEGGAGAGSGASGEGGAAGAGMCVGTAESCNRQDDDCDGATDEGARASCEQVILNAETDCVPFNDTARCVLLRCRPNFANCDGDPTNGCEEAFCACNECDDAGGEDAGSEDAGG
jgi:hypothetical protein